MMLQNSLFVLTCLLVLHAREIVTQSLKSTGGTLMLGDIPYYVPAAPFTIISASGINRLQSVNSLTPVTVISISARNSSTASLESIIGDFAADDVWNPDFLEGRLI